jgi:diguanylate cyclase (GGDEF)-like protein
MQADFQKRLELCRDLPTLPGVALRIVELSNDPDSSLADIVEVIAPDPALSVKFLKVANSPIYSRRRKIDNLRQALSLLGLNTAVTLALSFSLRTALAETQQYSFDMSFYWRRSLLAAEAARTLGSQRRLTYQDELFLAGLLQDIGMLVLDRVMPTEYGPLVKKATSHEQLSKAETQVFGIDHIKVGTWLLRQWGLPEYLQLSLAGSQDPTSVQALPDRTELVACVAVSGRIADVWLHPEDQDRLIKAVDVARHWLNMDSQACNQVLDTMATTLPEVAKLFDMQLTDVGHALALLDQAKEILVLRNLKLEEQAALLENRTQTLESHLHTLAERTHSLEHRTSFLEEQNQRDELTGLYNRRYLNSTMAKEFKQAKQYGWPLSLAFIDLDHFKKVNDTYGHPIGDQVLKSVGTLLMEQLRETDIIARYGGEEFVVLLPGVGEEIANLVLGRLLTAIRAKNHTLDAGPSFKVTASMGVAVHMGEGHRFASVEHFLEAADQALYKAKALGRNRLITDY